LSNAVRRVLDSGWYLLGKEVSAFEQDMPNSLGQNIVLVLQTDWTPSNDI
jgi:dTDP-4-amino-4,6-dideoxygalactose transaminase